ncbi:MAG: zinc ribbon domain-containing protein [Clostridiales bacterium]|nr:zinc ribbon domain-containing protein [Clostridiales bacterium]
MNVCAKCGKILQVEDEFCSKCGTPVEGNLNILDVNSDGTLRTREESIELAEELANKYEIYDNAKSEIEDLEHRLKVTQLSDVRPRYSTFRFFWKYFIWSYVAMLLFLIIGLIAISGSSSSDEAAVAIIWISVAVYIGVLILGGVLATRKRNKLNAELEAAECRILEKRRIAQKELEEKKAEFNAANAFLFPYNRRVPSSFRHKHRMRKVKDMIISGQAQNISEAITFCSPRSRES